MKIDLDEFDSVAVDDHTLGGTPRFPGTRIPVYMLLDYLASGRTVGEFLDEYYLDKEPVLEFLGELRAALRPNSGSESDSDFYLES